MLGLSARSCVYGLLVVALGPVHEAVASEDCRPSTESVCRAVKLLPREPRRVAVLDVSPTNLSHADAFVTTHERVVYVRRQGWAFQQSLKGHAFFDHVLAIVIWHEMAHLDGANEETAQRAEEALWMQYVAGRRVATNPGMEYLALLRKRRP